MISRRHFLAAAASSAVALRAQTGQRPPNIVFIMADDLGVGDLSCYGQKKFSTPNIDRLAAEGMRFTQAYAGCTVCAPSRSVLMTGYHMGHTSVRGNAGGQSLTAEDVTIPQLLQKAGYATGGFGKWGLGDLSSEGVPWKKGFDVFFGYLHQVHAHFFYPKHLLHNQSLYFLQGNGDDQRVVYSQDAIMDKALDFIEKNKEQPFFCYLPSTIPHLEYLVPPDSMAPFDGKFEEKPYVDPRKHYANQPKPRATYAAMISRLDRDVGRVLDRLKKLGLDDNTIVFFTSDNGAATRLIGDDFFESTAGLRGHKQNFYEGGIRTPMLARWPGRIKPGVVNQKLTWSFCDVLPTLCEVAGIAPPAGIDGISVLPTLLGRGKQRLQPYLYWELPRWLGNDQNGEFAQEKPMQAIRVGRWKAVRPKANGPLELYDLQSDPKEEKDLAAKRGSDVKKMEALLAKARTQPRPLMNVQKGYWET